MTSLDDVIAYLEVIALEGVTGQEKMTCGLLSGAPAGVEC